MSNLRYFQKHVTVPSVEPGRAEFPAHMGQRRPQTRLFHLDPALIAISPTHNESEVCEEVIETGDYIPPGLKRPSIESAPECRDVVSLIGMYKVQCISQMLRNISCLLTLSNQELKLQVFKEG